MQNNKYREEFQQHGYIICRNFFSEEEMTTLMEDIRATEINGDGKHVLNKGTLNFYSNLFSRSQKIQEFVSQPRLVDLLKQVIGPDFWIRWDQAVAKGPGAVTFPWHQDNAYSGLKDLHYQLWIALTKMTSENGGLWLVPGSHKSILPHKKIDKHAVYQGTPENPVFVEAKPGDVVLFSSLTLHSTTPNVSQDARWAYVVEYMSLDHFDPTIEPPYFVVARNGKRQPEFVNSYRGKLNIANQLKYLPRTLGKVAPDWAKNAVLGRK
ncbi:MAG: phytanoyl-CoA dioxygenase family protein [Symploca sp. SIO2B6]|nr:phytanoyl-CoA dioxygenase family protein [Symploca sp. SIO2B6]